MEAGGQLRRERKEMACSLLDHGVARANQRGSESEDGERERGREGGQETQNNCMSKREDKIQFKVHYERHSLGGLGEEPVQLEKGGKNDESLSKPPWEKRWGNEALVWRAIPDNANRKKSESQIGLNRTYN